MPTYDYECAACGHRLEAFQTFSEATLTRCPKCGKNRLQRLISPGAGFIFKGSGFYQTDYKNAPSGSKDKAEPKATPDKPAKESAGDKGTGDKGGGDKGGGDKGSGDKGSGTKEAGAAPKPADKGATDKGSGGRKQGPDKPGNKPA